MIKKIMNIINSRSKNFWLFLSYSSIHNLGKSVSSIFIPIILLQLGFPLLEVILYYIIFYGFNIIMNFFSKSFIVKFGVKKSFIIATTSLILFFILYLQLAIGEWYMLIMMALLMAIYDAFYFIARNYSIIDSSLKKENLKKNNVIINIIDKISRFFGPMIGAGVILFTENESIILFITIFILIISFFPLLKYKKNDHIKNSKINFKEDLFYDKERRGDYINMSLSRFSETAEGVLWPIFIYLVFESLDSVAFLSVLVVFVSLFFTYLTIKMPQGNKNKYIFYGAVGLIIIWILRYFFDSNFLLYGSSVLIGIFALGIRSLIDTSIFVRGKSTVPIISAFYKNQVGMMVGFIFYIIIFIMISFFELKDSFIVIIIPLIFLAVINYLISLRKKKYN